MACEAVVKWVVLNIGFKHLHPHQLDVVSVCNQAGYLFPRQVAAGSRCYTLCYPNCSTSLHNAADGRPRSIVLVVSPLIAQMKDQVENLFNSGLTCIRYSGEDMNESLRSQVSDRQYQMVFFSPKALLTDRYWWEVLQSQTYRSNLVALVNEAHCIKKWWKDTI